MTEDIHTMPTAAKKPRQRLSPEARNAQLLSLAVELTAQRGVGRVGHGDIAKAAKVSTGTVFNYFSTIEELNSAVIDKVQVWSQSFDDPFRAQFLRLKTHILEILKSLLGPRDHADVDAHIIYGTGLLYGQMKLEGYSDHDLTKLVSRVVDFVT